MPGSQLPMTRRHFLRLGIGGSVAGLAGCGGGEAESPPTTSTEEESVFSSVGVDGDFLVVEVAGSDALSTVNLIAPDGTLYGVERVQSGVRTVRFRLIELELSQSSHYTPGEYELVAVSGGDSIESQSIVLRPDLRIREVSQYQSQNDDTVGTHLAVVIENNGTAPTWIYDIAYQNAPNPGVNRDISPYHWISYLIQPNNKEDLILNPGQKRSYVSSTSPLEFLDSGTQNCTGSTDMTVLIGEPTEGQITQRILINIDGSVTPLSGYGTYSCTDVSVELPDAGGQSRKYEKSEESR